MSTQTAYAFVYLEVNLMAVLLLLIIRIKTRGISKMVAQRNLSMAIDAEAVCIMADVTHVLMENGVLPNSSVLVMAAKSIYFLSVALVCFFWFIYFEHLQDSPFVKNRKRVWIASALVWCMGLLLIVNGFNGILFHVDADGTYHRGPLFLTQYVLSYVYVLISSARALVGLMRARYHARREMMVAMVVFPLVPALAGILQYAYPELPMASAALSLETLVLYLIWLDEMISIDPLTRLNNRNQLIYHYNQWAQGTEEGPSLYLLLIDANKFKSINDTYGHIQGDAALARIAEALRLGCREFPRRANIARYGGDEFVILAYSDAPEKVERLRARINEILGELNRKAGAPYELSVSIGVARADPSLSLKELIETADQQLYEEKRARR